MIYGYPPNILDWIGIGIGVMCLLCMVRSEMSFNVSNRSWHGGYLELIKGISYCHFQDFITF